MTEIELRIHLPNLTVFLAANFVGYVQNLHYQSLIKKVESNLEQVDSQTDENEDVPKAASDEQDQYVSYNGEQLKVAKQLTCSRLDCNHTIIYGHHFESDDWDRYEEISMANVGVCPHCKTTVKGKRGVRKQLRMRQHWFHECQEYPYGNKSFKK